MSVELAALPAWLDDRAARGEFSGVVLLRRDGETVFEHAAGLASRAHDVPNTMTTRFAIASVAKWPLAVTVLRLVERGELDLHAPLADLLPAEQVPTAVTPSSPCITSCRCPRASETTWTRPTRPGRSSRA